MRDTLEAGAGLCDEAVVRTIVTEGPERIRELVELGLQFDEREISGHRELDLGKEGGHSKRRVLACARRNWEGDREYFATQSWAGNHTSS